MGPAPTASAGWHISREAGPHGHSLSGQARVRTGFGAGEAGRRYRRTYRSRNRASACNASRRPNTAPSRDAQTTADCPAHPQNVTEVLALGHAVVRPSVDVIQAHDVVLVELAERDLEDPDGTVSDRREAVSHGSGYKDSRPGLGP